MSVINDSKDYFYLDYKIKRNRLTCYGQALKTLKAHSFMSCARSILT